MRDAPRPLIDYTMPPFHACDTCGRMLAKPQLDVCYLCARHVEGAHGAEAALADLYMINYAVRNITTGDEEDIRILEEPETYLEAFPPNVRLEAARLILEPGWDTADYDSARWRTNQDVLLELLLPYISDRALYDSDYGLWEARLLGFEAEYLAEANA